MESTLYVSIFLVQSLEGIKLRLFLVGASQVIAGKFIFLNAYGKTTLYGILRHNLHKFFRYLVCTCVSTLLSRVVYV